MYLWELCFWMHPLSYTFLQGIIHFQQDNQIGDWVKLFRFVNVCSKNSYCVDIFVNIFDQRWHSRSSMQERHYPPFNCHSNYGNQYVTVSFTAVNKSYINKSSPLYRNIYNVHFALIGTESLYTDNYSIQFALTCTKSLLHWHIQCLFCPDIY